MCLYSKRSFPKIARKGIKCYKLLLVCNGRVMTPFMCTIIGNVTKERFILFSDNILKPEDSLISHLIMHKSMVTYDDISKIKAYVIENGFIHSFKDRDGYMEKKLITPYNEFRSNENINEAYIIAECTIPKWSLYYEGIEGDYASRKLIINKLL